MITKPADKKLIRLRELFCIKFDNINQTYKLKVRICARGDLIIEHDPTFAPVVAWAQSLDSEGMQTGIGSFPVPGYTSKTWSSVLADLR